jgi:hypothetical protein
VTLPLPTFPDTWMLSRAGIVANGTGYLLAGRDGSVYNFNTPFYGSKAGQKLPAPVAGITAAG